MPPLRFRFRRQTKRRCSRPDRDAAAEPKVAREVPPPLELACLQALWSLEESNLKAEGNVKVVQRIVAQSRPLAYTTIMTVLDRLVRKGKLTRRKVGRAYVYSPEASRDSMRRAAVRELLEGFFDGSEAAFCPVFANRRQQLGNRLPRRRTDGRIVPYAIAWWADPGRHLRGAVLTLTTAYALGVLLRKTPAPRRSPRFSAAAEAASVFLLLLFNPRTGAFWRAESWPLLPCGRGAESLFAQPPARRSAGDGSRPA